VANVSEWKTNRTGFNPRSQPPDPKQLVKDRELCTDALEAMPDSEFAQSCLKWVDDGKPLTDKQRAGLENTVNAGWDGAFGDDE
jgi:hypothetical protein